MKNNLWWWSGAALVGLVLLGISWLWASAPGGADGGIDNAGSPAAIDSGEHANPAATPVDDTEGKAFWDHLWTEERKSIEEPAAPVKWFEGELPVRSNFPKQHAFMPQSETERAALSGGSWLGTDDSRVGLFAEYEVSLTESGLYHFYVRKFWRHGPFRYRFDQGPWTEVDERVYLMDERPLRKHVVVNWVQLDSVRLRAGERILRIELLQNGKPAAFDAFVLSKRPFVPRGDLKPTATEVSDDPNWFVFDPGRTQQRPSFYAKPEAPAGDAGFLQVRDGKLAFSGADRPVRFWGVNLDHDLLAAPAELHEQYAKRVAEFGVNLVRLHGSFVGEDLKRVDPDKLRGLFSLHAALRRHGVYLALSTYFPLWHQLSESDGFAGYEAQHPFALPFIDQRFADVQRGWWKQLLTSPSPHTGKPLLEDPSLAFVELVNEDSTLFWTFSPYDTIPEPYMADLEQRFWQWLEERGIAAVSMLRSGRAVRGDDATRQRLGLMPLSEILQNVDDHRAQQTALFLAHLMRRYYQHQVQYLKGLGYRGLTVCSNWHTADEARLGPLDNWANLACDVMDRHGYFSGPHTGDAATYSIEEGHRYSDRSVLRFNHDADADQPVPEVPPFLEPRFNAKPNMVSELGWPAPNRFRGEGPLLAAAYGALHDVDGIVWFSVSKASWPRFLTKFEAGGPAAFGQFPAASRIYRDALVGEAPPVARIVVPRAAMATLSAMPLAVAPSLDALRLLDVPSRAAQRQEQDRLDPMWLLSGPIDVHLDDGESEHEPAPQAISTLERDAALGETPWGARKATITSRGGQLAWDFDTGIVKLEAPQAQFALGFVSRASGIALPDFEVEVTNEYAQVALVALDGRSLHDSKRMLLSVGTETRNAGYLAPLEDSGGAGQRRIEAMGRPPIMMRKVEARIRFRRSVEGLEITALDPNGIPLAPPRPVAVEVPLLPDVQYYHLQAAQ